MDKYHHQFILFHYVEFLRGFGQKVISSTFYGFRKISPTNPCYYALPAPKTRHGRVISCLYHMKLDFFQLHATQVPLTFRQENFMFVYFPLCNCRRSLITEVFWSNLCESFKAGGVFLG